MGCGCGFYLRREIFFEVWFYICGGFLGEGREKGNGESARDLMDDLVDDGR